MSIERNLENIRAKLPGNRQVTLVVVSKYATNEQLLEAYRCGVRDFGENRIQDVERKCNELPDEVVHSIRWHFQGHLQRNKVKKTRHKRFHLIHSVDSTRLAQKLAEDNEANNTIQPVLLQLNLTGDPNKYGFSTIAFQEACDSLLALKGIDVQGLMTIGPYPPEPQACIQCFGQLRALRDEMEQRYNRTLPHLSMGMTQDFEHALECGATIIRIGSGVFGS